MVDLYVSTRIREHEYGPDLECAGCGTGVTPNWPHTVEDCLLSLTNRISKLEDISKRQTKRRTKKEGRRGKTVSRR